MAEPATRTVVVEVEYLDVAGETCDRCSGTREFARDAVDGMRSYLAGQGVEIELVERLLDPSQLERSNSVFVNGRLAEEWLGGSATQSDCPSCSDLVAENVCCRAVEVNGVTTESVTREIIAEAILMAAEQ